MTARRLRWPGRSARSRVEAAEVRRFTAHRRRARRRLWIGLGAVAALVAFVAAGLFTPIMSVREIAVEGVERLPAATVERALDDLRGRPLALVTEAEVGQRLGGLVEVQSYSVRSEPPSRLVVEIVERRPVGALKLADRYEVYDAAGVLLELAQAPPAEVPLLELGGEGVGSGPFAAASSVMLALPAGLRAEVGTIQAASLDNVTLVLRDGDTVKWGSAEASARKAEVLATLRQVGGEAVRSYDVSSPDSPVTRTS